MDADYEAMLRRHSADGLLRSGNTIKKTMSLASESAVSLRDLMIEQFKWVFDESVVVTAATIDFLEASASRHFERIRAVSREFLKKSTDMAGQPRLYERMLPELETSIDASYEEVKTEIEANSIVNRNRGARGIAKTLFGWIPKLWGG